MIARICICLIYLLMILPFMYFAGMIILYAAFSIQGYSLIDGVFFLVGLCGLAFEMWAIQFTKEFFIHAFIYD